MLEVINTNFRSGIPFYQKKPYVVGDCFDGVFSSSNVYADSGPGYWVSEGINQASVYLKTIL